jgi:hypothetical protein
MFPSINTDLRKSTPPSDTVRYEQGRRLSWTLWEEAIFGEG